MLRHPARAAGRDTDIAHRTIGFPCDAWTTTVANYPTALLPTLPMRGTEAAKAGRLPECSTQPRTDAHRYSHTRPNTTLPGTTPGEIFPDRTLALPAATN